MPWSSRLTGAASSILGLLLATAATADPGLSLQPTRTLDRTFSEGTWMMPSLSPDGRTILFDLLGDIWSVDAKGGAAHAVLTGMPYDYHPVFSPDGSQFAFISDRSGVVSLWVADADGGNLRQLSHDDTLTIMSSPVWAADAKSIYVSRLKHDVLAFGLWRYPLDGGAPEPTIQEQPHGEDWDHRINALEGAISADGKTLYYSRKIGTTWTEKQPPNWSIVRRDLATGDETVLIEGEGGAMGVTLSHDGKSLVYAARAGATDELRLRNLDTGEDRRIAGPIDRDAQEQGYYIGLIPRFGFTPDDKALVTSVGGKLVRIDVGSGRIDPIPFSAHVQLPMGPLTRVQQHEDTGPVHARVIQYPTQSPDGHMLAFTALGTLYTEALDGQAKPKAVPGVVGHAFQPRWSPDGKRLVYVTWGAVEGGAVWTIPARGGRPTRLTKADALYTEPLFTPDGRTVVALRASQYDRLRAETEMDPKRATDIVRMPATGGAVTLITHAFGARSPDFGADPQRVRFYAPEGASSIHLDGTGLKREFSVLAHPASQYFSAPAPVQGVWLAPDGRHALIRNASELWLADVPSGGDGKTAPSINLDHPPTGTTKLTRIGADFAQWVDGGRSLAWSLGATWHRVPFASIDRASTGTTETQAQTFAADVTVPRDVPHGAVVLRGATVVTMRGDEVIRNADVVVQDNRIAAVGPSGSVAVPAGAAIRDVSGKYIVPGFVDAHAHWFETRRGVQDDQAWDFLINLAYGVTSGLDPQSFDTDVFVYKDMIDAGLMLGPRAWSTGPGVFVDANIVSEQAAEDVLTRYRDYYKDRNIKSYMVGDRARRQFMVEAARKLGMMETTEGASDYELDVTHAIDGFSGNEHSLPIAPLHDDVIQLFAQGGTSLVPTLNVLYGGEPPFSDEIIYGNLPDDPKIRHFMPSGVLASKLRDQHWSPAQAQSYPAFAANALRIQRAGGVVGAGSHGIVQGIGFHWELEALASGGTPMEALRAGTIGSATAIGHAADVGSIEPGKFADMLVLDADPIADIRNTRSIHWVMKNGRIYDPATLDEIAPTPRKLGPLWFAGNELTRRKWSTR